MSTKFSEPLGQPYVIYDLSPETVHFDDQGRAVIQSQNASKALKDALTNGGKPSLISPEIYNERCG